MSDRILTTHTGSLPRAAQTLALPEAVRWIVDKQLELGIDIVDDGEASKTGFVAYVNERLGGFVPAEAAVNPYLESKEYRAFPEFYRGPDSGNPRAKRQAAASPPHGVCTGPIRYVGQDALRRDLENLRAALAGRDVAGAFVPSASPASIEGWQQNAYYPDAESYVFAIADAMREEYRAIADAGFIVQIDDPWLAMHYMLEPDADVRSTYAWAEPRIAALNHALEGIPRRQVRHHTCYGINMGPRTTEMEMRDVLPLLLKIHAAGFSFEYGNPRHEHEAEIWRGVRLPDDAYLIPGVVTHTSLLVEHPELVAQRILRFVEIVGRERVVAGSDCGFASNPREVPEVHPSIVWEKLRALTEGARLASERCR